MFFNERIAVFRLTHLNNCWIEIWHLSSSGFLRTTAKLLHTCYRRLDCIKMERGAWVFSHLRCLDRLNCLDSPHWCGNRNTTSFQRCRCNYCVHIWRFHLQSGLFIIKRDPTRITRCALQVWARHALHSGMRQSTTDVHKVQQKAIKQTKESLGRETRNTLLLYLVR